MKYIPGLILVLFSFSPAWTQSTGPAALEASRIQAQVKFDGSPLEPFWSQAKHISQFTQREPVVGQPATESTEVSVVYDNQNLWIAVWCYQKEMNRMVAKSFQRDFDEDGEDNVQIVLSPYNDHRNGYQFMINPLGARMDALVSGNEETNEDWNGVWDAKAVITPEGWFAEIMIPFNTLKFQKSQVQEWALNVERNIQYKNEQSRWQGWSRDHNLANLAVAGRLTGIEGIHYTQRFEFKPYALGGWQLNGEPGKVKPVGKVGADLNYNVTANLKLNLTVNTDFAQVEADQI